MLFAGAFITKYIIIRQYDKKMNADAFFAEFGTGANTTGSSQNTASIERRNRRKDQRGPSRAWSLISDKYRQKRSRILTRMRRGVIPDNLLTEHGLAAGTTWGNLTSQVQSQLMQSIDADLDQRSVAEENEVLVRWNRGTPAQQRECLGLLDSEPIPAFQPRTPTVPPTTRVPPVQPTTAVTPVQPTACLRRSQRAIVLRRAETSTQEELDEDGSGDEDFLPSESDNSESWESMLGEPEDDAADIADPGYEVSLNNKIIKSLC